MAETRYIEGHSRYALSEMVGRGGFATVWRARPVGSSFFVKEDVAIKVIPVYNEGERSRALREGQIAEGLRHRNIVETIEVIPGPHEVYLVTEFVSGLPLDEAGRYYDCAEVTHALAQILEALVYAHGQGIIHRDIKPQNALVDRQGIVKLTDFGVAFRAGDTRLTRVGFAVGTPGYIAPEILDGSDPTALTDIYAVGATARTLLSHQPEEPSPRLREFVDRATSPNPSHRPQSAWAALKLLTGKKAPVTKTMKRNSREVAKPTARHTPRRPQRSQDWPEQRPKGAVERLSSSLTGTALRVANAGAAAYLGYLLGSTLFINGAEAAGVAVGFGVAGYLLPRLAALAVIVALAVVLLQGGVVGIGVGILFPLVGAAWVAGSGALNRSAARLPLGPLLAVPLAAINLAAGLPLLLGGLMRPLAAGLSAAFGAMILMVNDILRDDGVLPFYGGQAFRDIPVEAGPGAVLYQLQRYVTFYPEVLVLPVLWAAMAVIVSLGEWTRRPFVGLGAAVVCGLISYPLFVSESGDVATEAVTSLCLAAIMYAALRYLVARSRG